MIFGIDVSKWQGDFNFVQARNEGVKFAIIKAGGGDKVLYKDSKFEQNFNNAKECDLFVGAYFFGYARSVDSAIVEADYFCELLKDKYFELPVFYDIEASMLNIDKSLLTKIATAFCDRVISKGYRCGIYSSESPFLNKLSDPVLNKYPKWVAKYSKNSPKNSLNASIWQFGGEVNYLRTTKVAGVVCDQNYLYDEGLILEDKVMDLPPIEVEREFYTVDVTGYPLLYYKNPIMKNEYVLLLQKRLVELGYDPKGIDSMFGKGCEAAVKKYQSEHKDKNGNRLVVDGKVGQKTWYALFNL